MEEDSNVKNRNDNIQQEKILAENSESDISKDASGGNASREKVSSVNNDSVLLVKDTPEESTLRDSLSSQNNELRVEKDTPEENFLREKVSPENDESNIKKDISVAKILSEENECVIKKDAPEEGHMSEKVSSEDNESMIIEGASEETPLREKVVSDNTESHVITDMQDKNSLAGKVSPENIDVIMEDVPEENDLREKVSSENKEPDVTMDSLEESVVREKVSSEKNVIMKDILEENVLKENNELKIMNDTSQENSLENNSGNNIDRSKILTDKDSKENREENNAMNIIDPDERKSVNEISEEKSTSQNEKISENGKSNVCSKGLEDSTIINLNTVDPKQSTDEEPMEVDSCTDSGTKSCEASQEKDTIFTCSSETSRNQCGTEDSAPIGKEDISFVSESEKEGDSPDKHEKHVSLVDNQVQCVNLHCDSGYNLCEAPVFVLSYYGVTRRNVVQKVCAECFEQAVKHQELLGGMLSERLPLLSAQFPFQKDDVVVMDSVEEINEENMLGSNILKVVEDNLIDIIESAIEKYDLNFQLRESEHIIEGRLNKLCESNKKVHDDLMTLERQLSKRRRLIYKEFDPKIKTLPPIEICDEFFDSMFPQGLKRRRTRPLPPNTMRTITPTKPSTVHPIKTTSTPQSSTNNTLSPVSTPKSSNVDTSPGHDVIAVKEVGISETALPPIGELQRPPLKVGDQVYIMKSTAFGIWCKAKLVEIINGTYKVKMTSSYRMSTTKLVTGKQLAYAQPSIVRYPVGTRVIAMFYDIESPRSGKESFYVGIIAEPPKLINKCRYLVFFDDGYAQYVTHEKIHLVCETSQQVYEDIHSSSREFIKNYIQRYPERPMVRLQTGQVVRTEWNGKWICAKVLEVDCSLVKVYFDIHKRTELIYRGSTRLEPLYTEFIAAAARKEQGGLSRYRGLGISSLKKMNMPYVQYTLSNDQEETKPQIPTVSKNVAKKSTTKAPDSITEIPGPPKPHEKLEYPSKGVIRKMAMDNVIHSKEFAPHQCCNECVEWTKYNEADCTGINPLAIPLFFGFRRVIQKMKGRRVVNYVAPCGRRLRNMEEIHRYLRITKSTMGVDLFDVDHWVNVLDEFHLEPNSYCTYLKDMSYGHENTPISCVNEINHSWPVFMEYSATRIPLEGVNICLDEEFLVCCDCVDDCQDKEKCACWQLTIEGTKLGPNGVADNNVGYMFRRLPEPVITGIYECNTRCKCKSTCLNRVAQFPLQINLQIFRTLKKGWGIRTLNDIPQGGFVCTYAGRLHTEQSANEDGRKYGDEYLAELDYIEVVERFKEGYENEVVDPDGESSGNERHEKDDEYDAGEDENFDDDDDEDMDEDGCQNEINSMEATDRDYVPFGLNRLPPSDSIINTRAMKKSSINNESGGDKGSSKENKKSNDDKSKSKVESKNQNVESSKKTDSENRNGAGDETSKDSENSAKENKEDEQMDEGENSKDAGCESANRSEDDTTTNNEDEDESEIEREPSKFAAVVPIEDREPRKFKSIREMYGDGADECYVMDAKSSGNIGRYLNHSCQPNIFVQNVFVDTHDLRFPWVAFFALTHIKAGTELTWDYNYDVGSVPDKVLYCYCNSSECRGRLI